jgi:hypothetical protein
VPVPAVLAQASAGEAVSQAELVLRVTQFLCFLGMLWVCVWIWERW